VHVFAAGELYPVVGRERLSGSCLDGHVLKGYRLSRLDWSPGLMPLLGTDGEGRIHSIDIPEGMHMCRRTATLPIAVLALCFVYVYRATSVHGGEPSGTMSSPFSGKAIGISTKRPGVASGVYVNVEVKTLGQRTFLVGEAALPTPGENPYEGFRIWVPVDDIEQLWEYSSLEAARRSAAFGSAEFSQPEVVVTDKRIIVPFRVERGREKEIEKLILFVSRDNGEKWAAAAQAMSFVDHFSYEAPEDGRYCFAVQIVLKGGKTEPESTASLRTQLRVTVRLSGKSKG
jgi:hypothetical protein